MATGVTVGILTILVILVVALAAVGHWWWRIVKSERAARDRRRHG